MTGSIPSEQTIVVERLEPKHIRAVYPLIRLADPTISLSHWLRYATVLPSTNRAQRGVLIARRISQPYPGGAVCYRRERHIRASVLVAESFVALDLLHPEALISALLLGLNSVAAALGCQTIRAAVTEDGSALHAALRTAGYSLESVSIGRTLTWPAGAHC